jgi:chromosome segregation ATPase
MEEEIIVANLTKYTDGDYLTLWNEHQNLARECLEAKEMVELLRKVQYALCGEINRLQKKLDNVTDRDETYSRALNHKNVVINTLRSEIARRDTEYRTLSTDHVNLIYEVSQLKQKHEPPSSL